jgi:tryptophanyl-tRNA synthetase
MSEGHEKRESTPEHGESAAEGGVIRQPPEQRHRVFSGMQPSGEAHLGNYLGALRQWVELQETHDCVYCIVDDHALVADYDPADLPQRTFDLAVSYLAVGLDPEKCTIFVQSDVPEHTELTWYFNAVTPVGELERMTQFKDKAQRFESVPAGILNYPILQASDILIYKASLVPVGDDQIQHLELTREIARKFNARFGEVFPQPLAYVPPIGRIKGLDGDAKMSKSLDNTVGVLSDPDEVWSRVRTAVTDPQRVRRDDPGRPEVCNVFSLHQFFTDEAARDDIAARCRAGTIGCVDCKKILSENISRDFEPYREKAAELRANPDLVKEVLHEGARKARAIASATVAEVREKMGLDWASYTP